MTELSLPKAVTLAEKTTGFRYENINRYSANIMEGGIPLNVRISKDTMYHFGPINLHVTTSEDITVALYKFDHEENRQFFDRMDKIFYKAQHEGSAVRSEEFDKTKRHQDNVRNQVVSALEKML